MNGDLLFSQMIAKVFAEGHRKEISGTLRRDFLYSRFVNYDVIKPNPSIIVNTPTKPKTMKQIILISASIYGMLSVILGAMGAHAFKKILSQEQLQSFETGVKYQMYHAIVLLVIGFYFQFDTKLQHAMGWSFILGVLLFSFSIYLLSFSQNWGVDLKFLGPITPLGGILLIAGWVMLLLQVLKIKG